MQPLLRKFTFTTALALGILSATQLVVAEPRHLYLTLPEQDACHNLCLNLHITPTVRGQRTRAYLTIPEIDLKPMETSPQQFQVGAQQLNGYRFWLNNLKPGHSYSATLRVEGQNWTRSLKLNTPPDQGPIRFIVAGDSPAGPPLEKMLAKARQFAPDFYVYGGDLAYDNGEPAQFPMWEQWLTKVESAADGPNGMVPILAVIGNHEVQGGFLNGQSPQWERARPYNFFFHQGQNGSATHRDSNSYGFRQFGQQIGLWFLDSGHLASPSGAQSQWLSDSLKANSGIGLKLAAYHVPCYPSVRDYDEAPSRACRQAWCGLFEAAQLTAAFEHHDHALKRTVPILGNKKSPHGVVYLGDGCIGQTPRAVQSRWYLEKASSSRNFWLIQVNGKPGVMQATAVGEHSTLDSWESRFSTR